MSSERERKARVIESFVRRVEDAENLDCGPDARALVRVLMEVHGRGLARLIDLMDEADPTGGRTLDIIAADEEVGRLLILHGLHPLSFETRVGRALDHVRPYLLSQGADVRIAGVDADGGVHLALDRGLRGHSTPRAALELAIEEAVYDAAPDTTSLIVGDVTTTGLGAIGSAPSVRSTLGPRRPAGAKATAAAS